jgi:hypothetical protein
MMNPKSLANLRPPFEPGNNGNPGGKPKGARNRLTARFVNSLADDFEEHGKDAIEACRVDDPGRYLMIIASLVPREVEITRPLGDLTDDELTRLGDVLREIGERDASEGGLRTQH